LKVLLRTIFTDW